MAGVPALGPRNYKSYEALDSIIVSDNVTILENRTITLTSPLVRVAESVLVPETSELIG